MTQTIFLGEDLVAPLDEINTILTALDPLHQQQVLELLVVGHLLRITTKYAEHRMLMDGLNKHVWQLLGQAMGPRPSA